MFVEEGFRLRFANGETIDFYADDASSKEGWMAALGEVVGKDFGGSGDGSGKGKKGWVDIVLARERAEKAAEASPAKQSQQTQAQSQASSNAPAPRAHNQNMGPPPAMSSTAGRARAGTRSAPVSPMKNAAAARMPNLGSPAKHNQHSPTKHAHNHNQQGSSPTKRAALLAEKALPKVNKGGKDERAGGRRQAVRSMVF